MIHICNALLDVAQAATHGTPRAADARPAESEIEKSPSSDANRLAAGPRRWMSGSSFSMVRARAFGLWSL